DTDPIFGAMSPVKFWLTMAIVFGALFGGGLIVCGLGTKERVKVDLYKAKTKINFKSFMKSYIDPFKNKSFKWHIVMYVTAFMCMDIISALAAYYALDVWYGQTLFGKSFSSMYIVAPLMVAAVLAFPLARVMMDKKSKQFAFRMGLPFYIISGIMMAAMDPSWAPPILVPIVAFVMGLGFGGAQMMPWIIFPDTIDVAELKTGDRPTGNYSGIMTLVRKLAGALGVGMVGWVLSGVGYKQVEGQNIIQTPEVLLAIRLLMGLSIVALISIAMIASFKYKVNNHKLSRIRYLVEKAKGEEPLTEEEELEKAKLIEELA
ncbi:MFS transporter, partial [bacterium]|nr:MFS transporter [bacterium]